MNGKRAKTLRRQARLATEGLPAKAYQPEQHVVTKEIDMVKDGEKTRQRVRVTTTSMKLAHESTRGAYQALKKGN